MWMRCAEAENQKIPLCMHMRIHHKVCFYFHTVAKDLCSNQPTDSSKIYENCIQNSIRVADWKTPIFFCFRKTKSSVSTHNFSKLISYLELLNNIPLTLKEFISFLFYKLCSMHMNNKMNLNGCNKVNVFK